MICALAPGLLVYGAVFCSKTIVNAHRIVSRPLGVEPVRSGVRSAP